MQVCDLLTALLALLAALLAIARTSVQVCRCVLYLLLYLLYSRAVKHTPAHLPFATLTLLLLQGFIAWRECDASLRAPGQYLEKVVLWYH